MAVEGEARRGTEGGGRCHPRPVACKHSTHRPHLRPHCATSVRTPRCPHSSPVRWPLPTAPPIHTAYSPRTHRNVAATSPGHTVAPLKLVIAAVNATHDYSVFGSQLVEILIEFKWRGFARRAFVFDALLCAAY